MGTVFLSWAMVISGAQNDYSAHLSLVMNCFFRIKLSCIVSLSLLSLFEAEACKYHTVSRSNVVAIIFVEIFLRLCIYM